jgi:hypothetical protein
MASKARHCLIVVLAIAALWTAAGCGAGGKTSSPTPDPFISELSALCDYGSPMRQAATYEGVSHPLGEAIHDPHGWRRGSFADGGRWAGGSNQPWPQAVQLVACENQTPTARHSCGQYEDDSGRPVGEIFIMGARFDVRIVVASTGKIIASSGFDGDPTCESYIDLVHHDLPLPETTPWTFEYKGTASAMDAYVTGFSS